MSCGNGHAYKMFITVITGALYGEMRRHMGCQINQLTAIIEKLSNHAYTAEIMEQRNEMPEKNFFSLYGHSLSAVLAV
jgi:hypothetical protein